MMVPALQVAAVAGFEKQPHTVFSARLRLCELLCADLPPGLRPRVAVSRIEEGLPTPNRTLYTLRALAKTRPGERLALLIGEDQVASFSHWYKPAEILRLASLLVVGRGKNIRHPLIEGIATGRVTYLGASNETAASSEIRAVLAASASSKDGCLELTPRVARYVTHMGLYVGRKKS